MWLNEIYLIPIVGILTMYKIDEDVHLKGTLSEELPKFISQYVSERSMKVTVDDSVSLEIDCCYPKGTTVGMIFLDLVRRFSLSHEIDATSSAIITVTLKEAENGRFNSESKV